MQAVVRLPGCSGVLVRPGILLTSAHCVERPLEQVAVMGETLRVTACEKHPGYKPFEPEHDLGVCTLSAPTPISATPVAEPAELTIGAKVSLAGHGQSGAFARDVHVSPLRVVDTVVVGVGRGTFKAGTATETACVGDSGGPVLVERDGTLRVIGIIHGPADAVCASPAVVTPLAGQAWLVEKLDDAAHGKTRVFERPIAAAALVALLAAAVALALIRAAPWKRR